MQHHTSQSACKYVCWDNLLPSLGPHTYHNSAILKWPITQNSICWQKEECNFVTVIIHETDRCKHCFGLSTFIHETVGCTLYVNFMRHTILWSKWHSLVATNWKTAWCIRAMADIGQYPWSSNSHDSICLKAVIWGKNCIHFHNMNTLLIIR